MWWLSRLTTNVNDVIKNDRYRVKDMPYSVRSKRAKHDYNIEVDRMKSWIPSGAAFDLSKE